MKSLNAPGLWKIDAIGAGVFAAVTAVVWFVGVRPPLAARGHVAADQSAYAAAYQKSLEVAAGVSHSREQLTAAKRQRAENVIAIEPATRLNHRLATLNDLASKSDVRLDELQPNRSVVGNRYDLLPIHVTGSGSFQGAVAFLHRLHAACPDIGVATVNVQGQPAAMAKPAKFSVDLTWYTQATGTKSEAK